MVKKEVVKLHNIVRDLVEVRKKLITLVVNLNDLIDNDIVNLQLEVQQELNKRERD